MAAALKLFFDESLVRGIARDIARVHAAFPEQAFIRQCLHRLDTLELTARGRHIAECLHATLPGDFPQAITILLRSLGPTHTGTESFGMAPFRYLPHVFFVQLHGLAHFEAAMQAQYEITQRFSAESSIRPFLMHHAEETLARLRAWAGDPNPHVRRLVSEGTRPRLPWAPRLPAFQRDPTPVIELLERLKDDPVLYVRRSVANNLNDIAKDHPDLIVALCRRWARGASAERRWIIRHALRSLVKAGHRGALSLMGAGAAPQVRVRKVSIAPKRVAKGGQVRFDFELASTAKTAQTLLVDFAVHYVKANGAAKPKVFKLRRLTLAPRELVRLGATVSFADLTTRRHYPGAHRLDVLINGRPRRLAVVEVREAR
jgi:3-methyladenine DNA glycosylase AlkC